MLSDIEYRQKMNKIQRQNADYEKRMNLKAEKNKHKKKKTSTSKLLLLIVVFICIEIIAFTQYVMIKFQDLTALYTLIGVPVTLVPVALGYYYKSMKENTENGIVYETAVRQIGAEGNTDEEYAEQDNPVMGNGYIEG